MAGFCRRCGDIIRGSDSRCKCGGSSASSQVTKAIFEVNRGAPKQDRWLKTYGERRSVSPATALVSKSHSKSSASSQINRIAKPSNDMSYQSSTPVPAFPRSRDKLVDRSLNTLPSEVITSSTPSNISATTPDEPSIPKEVRRGLSVKSSARAHVRSLTANIPDSVEISAAEEEVLSNVFGSVLDPNETRGRCGACQQIFKREGKIYPDPRREDESGKWAGVFYCRKCYVERFSRGKCASCALTIVGDEGTIIQLGKDGCNGLWHKKCFKCVQCQVDVSNTPAVDLNGNPCCEECFEKKSRNKISSSKSPSITDIPDLRVKQPTYDRFKRTSVNVPAAKVIKPAVDELRNKLRKAGIEKDTVQSSPGCPSSSNSFNTRKPNVTKSHSIIPPTLSTVKPLSISKSASKAIEKLDSTPAALAKPGIKGIKPSLNLPSASAQHVLSPSANPLCPTCKLPLFKPSHDSSLLKKKASAHPGEQFCGTLATLPSTGETFHLDCLTCDDCNQTFTERKYVLLDNLKLCESCVAQRDLVAAQKKLEEMKAELAKRRDESVSTRYPDYRKSLANKEWHLANSESVQASFPLTQPLKLSSTPISSASMAKSASENSERLKKVSTSPFLGGSDSSSFKLPTITKSVSMSKLGGQAICPGCLKPGTINETKLGPNGERWHFKCLKCAQCHKPLDSGAKTFDDSKDVGCRDCLGKARAMKRLTVSTPFR